VKLHLLFQDGTSAILAMCLFAGRAVSSLFPKFKSFWKKKKRIALSISNPFIFISISGYFRLFWKRLAKTVKNFPKQQTGPTSLA